jgi:triosephosphate isomerase
MRKPLVAGNWKMHKTHEEGAALASAVRKELENFTKVEVAVCPPFTALKTVGDVLSGSHLKLGAQNMHHEAKGAFTGEISPEMLKAVFCKYVLVGHSERRAIFLETDAVVNRKVKAALAGGLKPVLCIGETLEERESGRMQSVIETQLKGGLADVTAAQLGDLVLAYEPVWAIGTGKTASPAQAQEVHAFIRARIAEWYGPEAADAVRILYGGSVKADNAPELFKQADIDGGLIGGAALEAASFCAIVKAAAVKL